MDLHAQQSYAERYERVYAILPIFRYVLYARIERIMLTAAEVEQARPPAKVASFLQQQHHLILPCKIHTVSIYRLHMQLL